MTEQPTLAEQLAALSPEERAKVEAAAEQKADVLEAPPKGPYDERQDGPLIDPRSLGPVGG